MDKVEKDYISSAGFTPDNIRTKSSAAAGLCAWVINICKYFRIYQVGGGLILAFKPSGRRNEPKVAAQSCQGLDHDCLLCVCLASAQSALA